MQELTKQEKANITRFTRDLIAAEYPDVKHLTMGRVRNAIYNTQDVLDTILDKGAFAISVPGFSEKLQEMVNSIPVKISRRKRSPEEKAKYEKKRRDAILETAQDGPVNKYSMSALRSSYLRGLKEEEREKAAAKFDRATKDVLDEEE